MARSRPGNPRGAGWADRRTAWWPSIAALFAVLLVAAPAVAHEVGLSRGEYVVTGAVIDAEITFSRGEIASLVTELDADRNGRIAPEELTRSRASIDRALTGGVTVQGSGRACPAKLEDARLVDEDGFAVRLQFRCRSRSSRLSFALPVLAELAHGHRHIAHVVAGPITVNHVIHRRTPSFDVVVGGVDEPEPPAAAPDAGSPFVAGLLAMITGLDHLAFVVALTLLGGRLRSIVLAAIVFTALYSFALALAAFDVLGPTPGFLGPAIALSVAYAGVEGWASGDGGERWRFVAPLGLLHGFGLAGALTRMALPAAQLPGAFVSFNLGVEVGQLAVLAVVVPLVLVARKRGGIVRSGLRGLSVILAVVGVFWLVARLASS